jgi:hypothetical protein
MASIFDERVISLHQAAEKLPPSRSGRPIHVGTLIRWVVRGVKGRRLEAFRVGSRWYTTVESLERFALCSATSSSSTGSLAPTKTEDLLESFGL